MDVCDNISAINPVQLLMMIYFVKISDLKLDVSAGLQCVNLYTILLCMCLSVRFNKECTNNNKIIALFDSTQSFLSTIAFVGQEE